MAAVELDIIDNDDINMDLFNDDVPLNRKYNHIFKLNLNSYIKGGSPTSLNVDIRKLTFDIINMFEMYKFNTFIIYAGDQYDNIYQCNYNHNIYYDKHVYSNIFKIINLYKRSIIYEYHYLKINLLDIDMVSKNNMKNNKMLFS